MKKIVLAEKPSVAKELAKVLKADQAHKTYFEGNQYIVTWAYGHLLTLNMPEDINQQWKAWQMETLPMIPHRIGIKPLPKTTGQLKAIKALLHRQDVESVVIATDAGREGELVARWILEYCHCTKPIERLWISSQTEKAIRAGFTQLQDGQLYNRLYESALARSKADWLVGLNVTRALTVKYQDNLSAGRVQTPTLALVRKQEEVIEKFVPKNYYIVRATYNGLSAQFKEHFDTTQQAQDFLETLKDGVVIDVKEQKVSQKAPLPYDLTRLQAQANVQFGFSAKKTLSIVQKLYEVYKVTSYPRTDSAYLTTDLKQTMLERLQAISQIDDRVKSILKQGGKVYQSYVFNDEKVGDHHALIPTEVKPNFLKMDADEIKVYLLIVQAFVQLFLPDYTYMKQTAIVSCASYQLQFSTQYTLELGWREESTLGKQERLSLSKGQQIKLNLQVVQQTTTLPKAYLEADLLQLMDKYNLGTPATRAEIIERLLSGELLVRTDRHLKVTAKGKQLLTLVHRDLTSPELTQKWEVELEEIAQGKRQAKGFLESITLQTEKMVSDIKQSERSYHDFNLTGKKCPECGGLLREKKTKQGVLYVCSSLTCDYRRNKDLKVTNKRCSVCHKKMVLIDGKNGAYFKCQTCQISEKVENKATKQKKVTKHEAKRLMQKINNNQVEVENPFAKAFKQIDVD